MNVEPRECGECGRMFDLLDPRDAAELSAGHDCEAVNVGLITTDQGAVIATSYRVEL